MGHKKYKSIENMRKRYLSAFEKGDNIVIQEKLDGSNASILYDGEKIHSYSRRLKLDESNTLNGFFDYAQTIKKVESLKRLRIFGEWLVKHTVNYREDAYSKFYLFDVYDDEKEEYLPHDKVKEASEALGLPMVEVFYEGEFIDWGHVDSFIGKSVLAEEGEGVVLKNMDKLNNPNHREPFYVKLVSESFQERKAKRVVKPIDPEALVQMEYETDLVQSIVTKPRVRKQLFTLVEDGVIPQDFDLKDMGVIARHIGRMIYDDCVKEEPEVVTEVGKSFGKYSSSQAMKLAKEIILDS